MKGLINRISILTHFKHISEIDLLGLGVEGLLLTEIKICESTDF